jgi:CheY-like chemotaxis protein
MPQTQNIMNNSLEILVVEDSPTQAELLKSILEQKAYSVSAARSTICSPCASPLLIASERMQNPAGRKTIRALGNGAAFLARSN